VAIKAELDRRADCGVRNDRTEASRLPSDFRNGRKRFVIRALVPMREPAGVPDVGGRRRGVSAMEKDASTVSLFIACVAFTLAVAFVGVWM
jgi:hypothetical protein